MWRYGDGVPIDPASSDWPYVQIAAELRHRIETGRITAKLPTLMALTEEFGVSEKTIRRALDVLKDEGLTYSQPGRGTFVKREDG